MIEERRIYETYIEALIVLGKKMQDNKEIE